MRYLRTWFSVWLDLFSGPAQFIYMVDSRFPAQKERRLAPNPDAFQTFGDILLANFPLDKTCCMAKLELVSEGNAYMIKTGKCD